VSNDFQSILVVPVSAMMTVGLWSIPLSRDLMDRATMLCVSSTELRTLVNQAKKHLRTWKIMQDLKPGTGKNW
jgi:hypothetical protein